MKVVHRVFTFRCIPCFLFLLMLITMDTVDAFVMPNQHNHHHHQQQNWNEGGQGCTFYGIIESHHSCKSPYPIARNLSTQSSKRRIGNTRGNPTRNIALSAASASASIVTSATNLPLVKMILPNVIVFNLKKYPNQVIFDFAALILGGSLLCGYHLYLFLKEKRGERTWRKEQADIREAWAQHVRDTQGWLYAIQTLRNAITAQTFLTTTVLSLLTVIGGRLWDIVRTSTSSSSSSAAAAAATATTATSTVTTIQLILFVTPMLSSAYYFLQSARLMTHAGFMFPVEGKNSKKVNLIMRKTEHSQWLGLRFLYLSGGILSWVVGGPRIFFVSSVLLTMFFKKVDQAPAVTIPLAVQDEEIKKHSIISGIGTGGADGMSTSSKPTTTVASSNVSR